MKTVTLGQILAIERCMAYPEGRVRELAGGKDGWTAAEILRRDDIPAGDRLWLVLRPEFLGKAIAVEFACQCAEDALALVDKPDERSAAAIAAARAYMRGEISRAELWAAIDAAASAAAAAADADAAASAADAAYAADAAAAAADADADAANYAADAAADAAAAKEAAEDAAYAAARDRQVVRLVEMLETYGDG